MIIQSILEIPKPDCCLYHLHRHGHVPATLIVILICHKHDLSNNNENGEKDLERKVGRWVGRGRGMKGIKMCSVHAPPLSDELNIMYSKHTNKKIYIGNFKTIPAVFTTCLGLSCS